MLLSERNELGGCNWAALGTNPADQRFQAQDATTGDVD
jgi:hypothetical protein